MSPPHTFAVFCSIMGGCMIAILAYQYARRRTLCARLAVVGLLAFFLLLIFGFDRQGFGAPVGALIRAEYRSSSSLRLVPEASVPYAENVEDMQVPGGYIELKVPVSLEGLPQDAKVRDTDVAIQMEGSGFRYAPPWQSATLGEHALAFAMPMGVFNRLAGSDVAMHLELIAEELRPARVVQSQASESFIGPMNGRCSLLAGKVRCRYAYREWVPTQVEAKACGGAMTATLRHVPAGGAPDPVVNEELAFRKGVCAGDEIRFSEYGSAGRFRVGLDMPTANLRQYRVR